MLTINDNIFIIPLDNGMNLVYAPLHSVAFYANQTASDALSAYLHDGIIAPELRSTLLFRHIKAIEEIEPIKPIPREINTSSNLVIILSQACNLACTYCYAQDSRSRAILDKDKLRNAIDYILDQDSRNKYFSFIGGGEPTITWELLQWAISYIRSCDVFPQERIGIGITTNGTILNTERIDFLYRNNVRVNVSFEILEDIQNAQRIYPINAKGSFDIVNSTIKELINHKIHVSFRSTITNLNVSRMSEMVRFVSSHYPTVKNLHFEPVTDESNSQEYYDSFIMEFINAKTFGASRGIEVYCSVSRNIKKIKNSFCRGEVCLTPTGDVVSCHRVSSEDIESFHDFKFAESSHYGFIINESAKKKVNELHNSKMDRCKTCFLKWNCGGPCSMEFMTISEKQRNLKCDFVEKLSLELLRQQLTQ